VTLGNLTSYGPVVKLPLSVKSGRLNSKKLLHIGVHNSANRNAGDTLLFPVVRRALDAVLGPFDWELRQAWDEFLPAGGGGLLLRDQLGSDVSNSGWQWNSSVEGVRALDIPLLVFAIGYNRFRGQADFDSVFREHLSAVAAKACFFGLRNSGSIRALSNYLPPHLAKKLRRQYCPTNALWQLYPEYRKMAQQHDARNSRVLAFNAAFDRPEHRFGESAGEVLASVARAVKAAEDRGWKIVVAAHKTTDRDIELYLDGAGVTYDTADLTEASPADIMSFYAKVDFAFGMRGHAQMIPFGLRRPIMSIISHDKMRFFLEDLGRLEWGVEVDAPDLVERLVAALHRVDSERETVPTEIARTQEAVWDETQMNLREIGCNMLGIGMIAH
jgi:polysaccharide pyruvyl transferase WcaK-like protein